MPTTAMPRYMFDLREIGQNCINSWSYTQDCIHQRVKAVCRAMSINGGHTSAKSWKTVEANSAEMPQANARYPYLRDGPTAFYEQSVIKVSNLTVISRLAYAGVCFAPLSHDVTITGAQELQSGSVLWCHPCYPSSAERALTSSG